MEKRFALHLISPVPLSLSLYFAVPNPKQLMQSPSSNAGRNAQRQQVSAESAAAAAERERKSRERRKTSDGRVSPQAKREKGEAGQRGKQGGEHPRQRGTERAAWLARNHGKRQADSAMHERAKDGCFLFSLARSVETEMKSRGNFHLCVCESDTARVPLDFWGPSSSWASKVHTTSQ